MPKKAGTSASIRGRVQRATFDGKSYGVANELEFIGIFYNKGMFEANGWEVPQSWDDLLNLCDAANAIDVIPMAFTNGESWPSYHMFSMMMNNQVGKEQLASMISGKESWDNEETVTAIRRFFVEARDRGCFIDDVNSVNYNDGQSLFATGKAAMNPTGTWRRGSALRPDADHRGRRLLLPACAGRQTGRRARRHRLRLGCLLRGPEPGSDAHLPRLSDQRGDGAAFG